MSPPIDPLDQALHALRSQPAILSGSFSQQLEDRLMQEFQRQQTRPAKGRVFWIGAAIVTVLAGTAASYPATKGWTVWPFSVYVGEDGVITNDSGEVIGLSVDNEDGSSTSVISVGGHMELDNDRSVKGMTLEMDIGEPEQAGGDGQGQATKRESNTGASDPK
jgi:hypothetical protein